MSQKNNQNREKATADIVATMDEDDRIRKWKTWDGHVYGYLNSSGYNWEFAETLLEQYKKMIDDAVVLGANDTDCTVHARYYSQPDLSQCIDQYQENEIEDGYFVGELALSKMNSRHSIIARDPFHNRPGNHDDYYLNNSQERTISSDNTKY